MVRNCAIGFDLNYVSHADIGGRPGFGKVVPEPEGVLFHTAWEPRVLALTLAMGATGNWNIDMSRAARETLPNYSRLSYYAIWFEALCKLLTATQLVSPREIASGHSLRPPKPQAQVLAAAQVTQTLAQGTPTSRAPTAPARFTVGDAVRTFAGEVPHHTRLPQYVRGKRGIIERVHGMHVFADAHASGRGEQPQWLYAVVFDGAELWGSAAQAGLKVSVDAWEPYLSAD
jgi:nitrile hydratase